MIGWLFAEVSRHFLEIKAIWLAFDSLIYFTTEHLIFYRKGGKSSNYPVFERFRVRGLVIFREGVSTLNIHSILWEPLDFI